MSGKDIAVRTIEISQTHTRAFYVTCRATQDVGYMNLGGVHGDVPVLSAPRAILSDMLAKEITVRANEIHRCSLLHVSYYLRHRSKKLQWGPPGCIESVSVQPAPFVVRPQELAKEIAVRAIETRRRSDVVCSMQQYSILCPNIKYQ